MLKYSLPAVAAALLLCSAAQAAPRGMSYSWQSPEQNVARSQAYDHLLEVSWGFRHYRMHKECNPIDFVPALRTDCVASFDQYEPMQR